MKVGSTLIESYFAFFNRVSSRVKIHFSILLCTTRLKIIQVKLTWDHEQLLFSGFFSLTMIFTNKTEQVASTQAITLKLFHANKYF